MLFGSILTCAVLALTGVSSSPTPEPEPNNSLEERTYNHHCPSNSYYKHGKCVCETGYEWDWHENKCKFPCWEKPRCPPHEKAYCLKSKNEWCPWDWKKPECQKNGHSIVVCCREKDIHDVIHSHYPDHHQKCDEHNGFMWNPHRRECTCQTGKYWDGHHCKWRPMPKPHCPEKQKPYCGESRHKYCGYNEHHDYCKHDGKHLSWCCHEKDLQHWLDKLFWD